jgi:hypothetical protein
MNLTVPEGIAPDADVSVSVKVAVWPYTEELKVEFRVADRTPLFTAYVKAVELPLVK